VHLIKDKSSAGIAGNESADALAKYQATQVDTSHADTGIPRAGIGGNPFHDVIWLAFARNNPLDAKMLRSSEPHTLELQYFSNLHICTPNTRLTMQTLQLVTAWSIP